MKDIIIPSDIKQTFWNVLKEVALGEIPDNPELIRLAMNLCGYANYEVAVEASKGCKMSLIQFLDNVQYNSRNSLPEIAYILIEYNKNS